MEYKNRSYDYLLTLLERRPVLHSFMSVNRTSIFHCVITRVQQIGVHEYGKRIINPRSEESRELNQIVKTRS